MPVGVCWLLLETYAKTCVLHVGSTSEKKSRLCREPQNVVCRLCMELYRQT